MCTYSEDDEDDVSSLSSAQSFHSTPTPPPPAVRSRGETGRMGGIQVLPMPEGGPPIPPRHSPSQLSFGSSGNSSSGSSGNIGRALPPVPQQQMPPVPQQQMPPVPSPQPRQLPQPVTRARPPSTVGAPYGRPDTSQFGPGKQEKEVRKGDTDSKGLETILTLYVHKLFLSWYTFLVPVKVCLSRHVWQCLGCVRLTDIMSFQIL